MEKAIADKVVSAMKSIIPDLRPLKVSMPVQRSCSPTCVSRCLRLFACTAKPGGRISFMGYMKTGSRIMGPLCGPLQLGVTRGESQNDGWNYIWIASEELSEANSRMRLCFRGHSWNFQVFWTQRSPLSFCAVSLNGMSQFLLVTLARGKGRLGFGCNP